MDDPSIIHKAYADTFRQLFVAFLAAVGDADSTAKRALAKHDFRVGVQAARTARNQALTRCWFGDPARGRLVAPQNPFHVTRP